MIDGVLVKDIIQNIDARGFFSELIRMDWSEMMQDDAIVQINYAYSYPGIVRAWHKHLRGQVDYFICIDGAVQICAYDDREDSESKGELVEHILSDKRMRILRIPGDIWHGYTAIGVKPLKLIYGVNKLYDYDDPDEERVKWNDENIIPISINGNKEDPRVNKPWKWNYSSNK